MPALPSTPPPEPRVAPPDGRLFPCESCGAGLHYHPGAEAIVCPYCAHRQEIPCQAGQVAERPFEAIAPKARVPREVLVGVECERRCGGCGAVNMMSASVAMDRCVYCGAVLDNPVEAAAPMHPPDGVLPFHIPEADARTRFRAWIKSLWFAPNDLVKLADMGRIDGAYLPHWTFDAMTWSFYTGARGDAYYVTVGSGKNRRQERRIRWTPKSGRVDHWFDDVLVSASPSLPQATQRVLAPWELGAVQPYRAEFLSGFRTERYRVEAETAFVTAREEMDTTIRSLVRRDIGGDEQRIDSLQTHHGNVTCKLLLLPVWIAAYQYRGKAFRVLVNARTGEVTGDRPWSIIKITLAVLGALILIAILSWFVATNSNNP